MGAGTALALQLGHRLPEDLDFFSAAHFEPAQVLNALVSLNLTIQSIEEGTLHLDIQGQKISFLYYPYPLLCSTIEFRSCQLADYRDIAAMKVIAAAQRGSKKDFVDLHYLMINGMTAEMWHEALRVKYAGIKWCWPVVVKGLAYFDDAETDAMPMMMAGEDIARPLTESEWQNIKQDLTALQVELLRNIRC